LRIWLDILTPKQVLFFKPIVDNLIQLGNDVLCTSRQYRECTELAKKKSLKIKIVGSYGGYQKYDKLRESSKRTYKLAEVINQFDPTVAVNFCSPEAARVAFGLSIPQVVFNDSPHAYAVGKLTLPFVQYLLCPWIIPYEAWKIFGIQRKQITRYKALDPVLWLKRFNSDDVLDLESLRAKYRLSKEKTILIRPEESKAAYMINNKKNNILSEIEAIIENFHEETNIVLLSRYEDQAEKLVNRFGSKAIVLSKTIDGLELLSATDIFIGAGGTMTAEAALIGKPTISISPIDFYVDNYLIRTSLVRKARNPKILVDLTRHILNCERISKLQNRLAHRILYGMEDPITKLHEVLDGYITL
jgi:predicted glycosyltransferase